MDTVATTEALTVRDNAPALAWLTQRPHLPTPRQLNIGGIGEGPSISVCLDTAEQVQAWADAMGVDMTTSEHKGKVQHAAYTFEPFYMTATAIVDLSGQAAL